MMKELAKEKRVNLLRKVSISLIAISIILGLTISIIGKQMMDTNTVNQITTAIIQQERIKSNEINYIRKLDYKFYEIILDDGDVYTFKKTEKGKNEIKRVGDKIKIEDEN